MFSLNENFFVEIVCGTSVDFYPILLVYLSAIFIFLDGTRSLIPDIDLLQLIPGSYFLLCLLTFIFFILQSQLLTRVPFELDLSKRGGIKVKYKIEFIIILTLCYFLFSNVIIFSSNSIIPLSLDYFQNSGGQTLQNYWSLAEVIELETIIFFFLISFSQIPLFFILNWNTLKPIKKISKFWKFFLFFMTVAAGILTPTLDGATQLAFVSFTVSFYLFLINLVHKKSFVKFNFFLSFGG